MSRSASLRTEWKHRLTPKDASSGYIEVAGMTGNPLVDVTAAGKIVQQFADTSVVSFSMTEEDFKQLVRVVGKSFGWSGMEW